jgi:catechol 2,3-dioxygenase
MDEVRLPHGDSLGHSASVTMRRSYTSLGPISRRRSAHNSTVARCAIGLYLRTMNGPLELSHIAFRTPNVERSARFYVSIVGMVPAEREPDGRIRLGWGRGHHALELLEGVGFDHVGLEAEDDAIVHFHDRLVAHGVDAEWEQPWGAHPRVLTFADPDGHRIELHGSIDRSGEGASAAALRPTRIHHVTFASGELARMIDFYVEVLGFRISDTMGDEATGDVFTWLRCNREHHTVAVVQGDEAKLDHHAFEIASWAEMGRWCDELAAKNVPLTWGPGRHGPGNNLFVMFDDLDGRHVELSCEMERFWDDHAAYARVPRRWAPEPSTVNLWGPTPAWRGDVSGRSAGSAA